ncbi:MAG: DsbA family protein [Patescibacteria group bacterium]
MDQQPQQQPAPPTRRRVNVWAIIAVALMVVVLGFATFFYVLVRQNLNQIKNQNQQSGTTYITSSTDPYLGGVNAPITVVVFSDFQCPYCFQAFPVVRQIAELYQDQIKLIFRDFPITDSHPQAQKAAEAGKCAHQQGKFWEMHDKMFINQSDLSVEAIKKYAREVSLDGATFDSCLDSGQTAALVQRDLEDGITAGVDGTPTFFVNDRKFAGAVSLDSFRSIIDPLISIYSRTGTNANGAP